ncbi:MAG: hypothetical protein NDJ89_15325 [Oligoflexia bacterium]|nr:hypothetical protein [Oligoflexia bacterium]
MSHSVFFGDFALFFFEVVSASSYPLQVDFCGLLAFFMQEISRIGSGIGGAAAESARQVRQAAPRFAVIDQQSGIERALRKFFR